MCHEKLYRSDATSQTDAEPPAAPPGLHDPGVRNVIRAEGEEEEEGAAVISDNEDRSTDSDSPPPPHLDVPRVRHLPHIRPQQVAAAPDDGDWVGHHGGARSDPPPPRVVVVVSDNDRQDDWNRMIDDLEE